MISFVIYVYFFYLRIELGMCLSSICIEIELLWNFFLDQMNNVVLDIF